MERLVYNIAERTLKGKLGSISIDTVAGSGGRASSKVKGAENVFLANNCFATHIGGESSRGTHNYGPLPMGLYSMKIHETRKNWIRLIPHSSTRMHGRAGMAIHGRGEIGSHGCIVPNDFSVILDIIEELKANKGREFTLEVVCIGSNVGWQNSLA